MEELYVGYVIKNMEKQNKEEFNIKDWQPYRSHEYIVNAFEFHELEGRGFVVGCHGENISTTFTHRYKGRVLSEDETKEILIKTGTLFAEPLKIKPSMRLRLRKVANIMPLRNLIKAIYYKLPGKLRII